MSVYNASSLAYTKALKDLIDRDKKPAQKTGGLLQRNMPKKVVEEKKNPEPDRTLFWHEPRGRPARVGSMNTTALRQGNLKYIDFYDDETRDYVGNLYRADIRNFKYTFEDAL